MIELRKAARRPLPALPFAALAREVLGPRYELSVVFIGAKRSRALNRTYRGKDKPANVLAFPLTRESGELFLTPIAIPRGELLYLFIHGLLHLKGLDHGHIMEQQEKRLLVKWQKKSSQE